MGNEWYIWHNSQDFDDDDLLLEGVEEGAVVHPDPEVRHLKIKINMISLDYIRLN